MVVPFILMVENLPTSNPVNLSITQQVKVGVHSMCTKQVILPSNSVNLIKVLLELMVVASTRKTYIIPQLTHVNLKIVQLVDMVAQSV